MKVKFDFILLVFFATISSCQQKNFQDEQSAGRQIYLIHCAGCHGSNLQGAAASPLIKTEWTYGRRRSYLLKNVRFGIQSTEMIAWNTILTDDEIEVVVDYILEAQDIPVNMLRPIPRYIESKEYSIRVENLFIDQKLYPWGIEFVNPDLALLIERSGKMRWIRNDKLDDRVIEGLPPPFISNNFGGYFDIALDPNYEDNGWIYLSFSDTNREFDDKSGLMKIKITRGKIEDYKWVSSETLFEVPESQMVQPTILLGGGLLFDERGFLYFSIGSLERRIASQDLRDAAGKVFRIHPDGSIPSDNPFIGEPGSLQGIFTIGHRNIQGIAQHPTTRDIWTTEHGPMGGDELNILNKGCNYGWPVITHGLDYDGTRISHKTEEEGMEQPIIYWTPSIGVSPATFVSKTHFHKWENNLLIGALAFEEVRRLVILNNMVVEQEIILKGYGRVRDLKFSPDGSLYVLLNGPGRIVRLIPESI
jgi:glucose/arabinose dehydrogenase/cytochrome c5